MGTNIVRRGVSNAESVAQATDLALDGGSVANVFTISGGPILLLALIAEITEAVSANACNAKWVADPTAGADTDMCAVFDIASAAVGTYLTIDGTIANAMVAAVPATALPLGIGMDIPLIIPVGTIDLNLANSDPTSGIATAYMRYMPIGEGAKVVGS
jgi:hypothetical protein